MRDNESGPGIYKDFAFGADSKQPSMKEYGYDYWFATGNVARPSHKDPLNFFLNGTAMGKMEGFSAQIVAREIADWLLIKYRKKGQPFFMTVWFHEPHGPIDSDPEFIKRYKNLSKDPSLPQYLANVTQIDEAVGTIVKILKDEGLFDNTLIWYSSDNGPEGPHDLGSFNTSDSFLGGSRYRGSTGGLRGRKRHTHEGGIRVPGIICWPAGFKEHGVSPGSISTTPIIGSDVFPTLLELAGIALPEKVTLDGESIVSLLKNGQFNRSKPLYWRNTFKEFQVALRDGD